MSIITKALKYIGDSGYRFKVHSLLGLYNNMPDEEYICKMYKIGTGKELNINEPSTFNEKLQWLKLNDRKPYYTTLVDKHLVKLEISKMIGEEYVIPTLGVWEKFEDIDFDALPNQFVLKCTHDSGGLVICKDKEKFNYNSARKKINKCLRRNFFFTGREWPYKNVKPRIIAESYLDNNGIDLEDYKFHCFNGEVKFILVCRDRFSSNGLTEDFFDIEWNHLDVRRTNHPNSETEIKKPRNYEKMVELAMILSKNIPFVRVDFYDVNGKIYFGEVTFFPASGFERFIPDSFDQIAGEWIKI